MVAVLFCCPGTIDIAAAYLKARKEAENISIFDENSRRIAVIGGDEREQVAAARLAAAGYRVYCYGRPQTALAAGVRYAATAAEALEHAGALILPQIPLLNERIYNAEGAELVLSAEEWHLAAGALLLTGRETPYLRQLAAEHRLRIAAVAADARLLQLSSRATAEAALAITVRQHPGMVQGSRVLVLGCGALGLELIAVLTALGADVEATNRSEARLPAAEAAGAAIVPWLSWRDRLAEYDLIYNTVPAPMLGEAELRRLRGSALIVDLASRPGGTDFAVAERLGKKALLELGLPGKYAPQAMGAALAELFVRHLEQEEI
ncbi:MAG: dipicolinic acid synthetase subunit A [Firmicutes bacterium]|nr:dipicolinic acid synthetase subunit A [Bacillota bacterium]